MYYLLLAKSSRREVMRDRFPVNLSFPNLISIRVNRSFSERPSKIEGRSEKNGTKVVLHLSEGGKNHAHG